MWPRQPSRPRAARTTMTRPAVLLPLRRRLRLRLSRLLRSSSTEELTQPDLHKSWYRLFEASHDLSGDLREPRIAAVEMLNILRPTHRCGPDRSATAAPRADDTCARTC